MIGSVQFFIFGKPVFYRHNLKSRYIFSQPCMKIHTFFQIEKQYIPLCVVRVRVRLWSLEFVTASELPFFSCLGSIIHGFSCQWTWSKMHQRIWACRTVHCKYFHLFLFEERNISRSSLSICIVWGDLKSILAHLIWGVVSVGAVGAFAHTVFEKPLIDT